MADHGEALALFASVTGAPPHVAEHYLSGQWRLTPNALGLGVLWPQPGRDGMCTSRRHAQQRAPGRSQRWWDVRGGHVCEAARVICRGSACKSPVDGAGCPSVASCCSDESKARALS